MDKGVVASVYKSKFVYIWLNVRTKGRTMILKLVQVNFFLTCNLIDIT